MLRIFSNLKIRAKIIVILLPVVLTFFFTSLYVYFSMSQDLRASIIDANMKNLVKIQNEIELNFNNLSTECVRLIISPNVQTYLQFAGSEAEETMIKAGLLRTFPDYSAVSGQLAGSMFVIKSESSFAYYSTTGSFTPAQAESFASSIWERGMGMDSGGYLHPEKEFFGRCGVLHYVVPAGRAPGGDTALLVVNINPLFLANIFSRYYTEGSRFRLYDTEGRVIYQMPDGPEAAVSDEEMLTFEQPLEVFDWTLSVSTPRKQALFRLDSYRDLFLVTSVVSLLVAVVLIAAATGGIVHRVREIRQVMGEVRGGKLDSRFPVRYSDEISEIGNDLNHMVKSLRDLRFDVAERALRQQEAELIALQSQINPHFLYNTLETVRMVALKNRDPEAGDMVSRLSRLLRYTIDRDVDSGLVTVQQEIEQVELYVSIQKIRFRDRFVVQLDIAPEILGCACIKLILQPLVENAFQHGLRDMEEGGVLHIVGRLSGADCVLLTVQDNGNGIPADRLMRINEQLSSAPIEFRGVPTIGLHNVSNRLRLFYGSEAAMWVESQIGAGTATHMLFPAHPPDTTEGG